MGATTGDWSVQGLLRLGSHPNRRPFFYVRGVETRGLIQARARSNGWSPSGLVKHHAPLGPHCPWYQSTPFVATRAKGPDTAATRSPFCLWWQKKPPKKDSMPLPMMDKTEKTVQKMSVHQIFPKDGLSCWPPQARPNQERPLTPPQRPPSESNTTNHRKSCAPDNPQTERGGPRAQAGDRSMGSLDPQGKKDKNGGKPPPLKPEEKRVKMIPPSKTSAEEPQEEGSTPQRPPQTPKPCSSTRGACHPILLVTAGATTVKKLSRPGKPPKPETPGQRKAKHESQATKNSPPPMIQG
ncbi:basic salivary proline-rich protein 1-like [Penaeus monodon]|uniref:basic salivary proline-rich protein 1-like n=1 Tax=Penaeus monodon TaxID=6687 RepID=UPI0018A6FF30|nr:basic salivary proline-rich protein 1-like [Penaeus monodon]